MSVLKRIFCRLNGLPYHYKNIWYNQSIWVENQKYPIVFDFNKNYIEPKVGNIVVMGLKKGKPLYYKITNIIISSGGDWFYDSDALNVDLIFVSKGIFTICFPQSYISNINSQTGLITVDKNFK